MSMTKELPKDIAEFFRKTGRMGGKIGGKRSLETMTPEERRERARKAAVASAEARRNGARQRSPAAVDNVEESRSARSQRQALILADQILNRLTGYARKGSRARNDFYRRDLNWMADVVRRLEAGERDPLRPTAQ